MHIAIPGGKKLQLVKIRRLELNSALRTEVKDQDWDDRHDEV